MVNATWKALIEEYLLPVYTNRASPRNVPTGWTFSGHESQYYFIWQEKIHNKYLSSV